MTEKALLKTDQLTIRFGGLVAVNAINLEIREGELVGLIGPNGAGKTTAFNLLTGVYAPTSGKVLFDGCDVSGLAPHAICRKGMSRTFQNIRLFKELSVLDNILVSFHGERKYSLVETLFAFPRRRSNEKRLAAKAMETLKAFGLADKAGIKACSLPYGEQRKLEIARALATNPKLLLLDEPAAGMNPTETAQLSELILKIRREFGVTILLIEHDMSLVMKICERIYVLDYGELIAEGKPAEIRSNKRVIEAYLGGGLASV